MESKSKEEDDVLSFFFLSEGKRREGREKERREMIDHHATID